MTTYKFDDRTISWTPFNGFKGLHYAIQSVDPELNRVDMLMRFEPNTNCVPHTHVGVTKTLVLEGEHRIYRPDGGGGLGEPDIRPAGTFSENRGDETHVEGGGPEGAIILLSMQAVDGNVYDILREDLSLERSITLDNFARGLERQRARPTESQSAAARS